MCLTAVHDVHHQTTPLYMTRLKIYLPFGILLRDHRFQKYHYSQFPCVVIHELLIHGLKFQGWLLTMLNMNHDVLHFWKFHSAAAGLCH